MSRPQTTSPVVVGTKVNISARTKKKKVGGGWVVTSTYNILCGIMIDWVTRICTYNSYGRRLWRRAAAAKVSHNSKVDHLLQQQSRAAHQSSWRLIVFYISACSPFPFFSLRESSSSPSSCSSSSSSSSRSHQTPLPLCNLIASLFYTSVCSCESCCCCCCCCLLVMLVLLLLYHVFWLKLLPLFSEKLRNNRAKGRWTSGDD